MTIDTAVLSAVGTALVAAVTALWRAVEKRGDALTAAQNAALSSAVERERASTVALTRAADALDDTHRALTERTCPHCEKALIGRAASRSNTGEHPRATMAPEAPR